MEAQRIVDLTQRVWSTVIGLHAEDTEAMHDPPDGVDQLRSGRSIASCVHIVARREIAIVVHVSSALARRAAASMLAITPEEASREEMQDAIGELANIIGGSVKTMADLSGAMSVPTVVEGIECELRLPGTSLLYRVMMSCEGEPLVVSVYEQTPLDLL